MPIKGKVDFPHTLHSGIGFTIILLEMDDSCDRELAYGPLNGHAMSDGRLSEIGTTPSVFLLC